VEIYPKFIILKERPNGICVLILICKIISVLLQEIV